MKTKEYVFNGIKYYRLYQVVKRAGLGYHEVYHNYEKWQEPLGLLRYENRIYCAKEYADIFIRQSRGYVPREYYYKRDPYRTTRAKKYISKPRIINIRNSIWVKKLSHSESNP